MTPLMQFPHFRESCCQMDVEGGVVNHAAQPVRMPPYGTEPEGTRGLALARICSGVFTQAKGWQLSFQAFRKRSMAVRRAARLWKTPRRMAARWRIANQPSTWFIQLALVGVK